MYILTPKVTNAYQSKCFTRRYNEVDNFQNRMPEIKEIPLIKTILCDVPYIKDNRYTSLQN